MLNLKKKLVFLTLITAIILVGTLGFTKQAQAEYYSAGTSTSVDLLSGIPLNTVDSFYVNASSIPATTTLKFRYSTTSTSGPWVNSNGTSSGWDEITSTGGATTSLSGLGWNSVQEFYYQVRFESNGSSTPELDSIGLNYHNSASDQPFNPSPSDGQTGVSPVPTLSVDVYDENGDDLTVTFYDNSDDSVIGSMNIASSSPAATSTASTTWSELSASTTYNWYAVADDGVASTTSSVWSFTTKATATPVNLKQYEGDCTTVIGTSSWTTNNSICFEAEITPANGNDVKLQVEYSTSTLSGAPVATSSSWCSTTCTASIVVEELSKGNSFKWQVRSKYDNGGITKWNKFNAGNMAFGISEYYQTGTSTSADLLGGVSGKAVKSFYYDASSISPASSTIKFRYSTTSTSGPWVNSNGTQGGWDEVTTTGGATTSLTGLEWDSAQSFYYQARFEAASSTPELNEIRLSYGNSEPDTPSEPTPSDGADGVSLNPELSVKVHDDNGNSLNVSFYDVAAGTLIGTASVASTSPAATSTASITWSGLDAGTAYSWHVKASDGEATTTSGVWSFTTYQPPAFPSGQYQGDCSTTMAVSSWVDITTICFGAQIIPNDNHDVKLQLDYSTSTTFDGVPDATSSTWKSSTTTVTISQSSLPWGQSYKWQVRTVDDGGAVSEWTKFNSGNMAFGISEYYLVGTSTSANLLSGKNVDIINTFYYDATSLPAGSALKFRFATSSSGGPWYNAQGVQGGWSKARTTGGAVFDLEDLGWSGSNFYYQARFEADYTGLYSPALDLIKVTYNNNAVIIEGGERIFKNIQIKQ